MRLHEAVNRKRSGRCPLGTPAFLFFRTWFLKTARNQCERLVIAQLGDAVERVVRDVLCKSAAMQFSKEFWVGVFSGYTEVFARITSRWMTTIESHLGLPSLRETLHFRAVSDLILARYRTSRIPKSRRARTFSMLDTLSVPLRRFHR